MNTSPPPKENEKRDTTREDLRALETYIRDFQRFLPLPVCYVSPLYIIIDVNESFERVSGYKSTEVIGENLEKFFADPQKVEKIKKEISEKEEISGWEINFLAKEKNEIPVILSARARKDEKGDVTGFFVSIVDITDRKRAEDALQKSELRYRVLFESTLAGTLVLDAETMRVVLANKAVTKMFGFDSPEEVIGINPLDFVHPEDRDRAMRIITEDMFTKDLRQPNEFRAMTKDGREIWVRAVGARVEYQGKVAGLISVADITESKRAEEALRQSEEKYRSLVESSDDPIYILSRDLRYLSANKALLSSVGLSSENEIVGRLYSDFHSPAETRELLEVTRKIFDTGEVVYQEHEGRVPGTWFLRTLSPYRDPRTGEVVAVIVVSKNITEYKRMKEERAKALAEAAEGRAAAETIEGMIDGVVITDLDGRIIQNNAASCEMFRTTKEKSIGKHFTEFILPEEVPWVLDVVSKALKTGKPVRNLELTAVREDGSRFPILVNGTLLRNEKGEPNRFLIVYRDITELKRLQEERARLERARAEETERFTKELQAKVEELEKLHRLTVGRELKMIQLEEKIKKLEMKGSKKQK